MVVHGYGVELHPYDAAHTCGLGVFMQHTYAMLYHSRTCTMLRTSGITDA